MAKKTSPISIEVTVDENNIPEKILWSAPDGGVDKEVTQAILWLFGMEKIKRPLG